MLLASSLFCVYGDHLHTCTAVRIPPCYYMLHGSSWWRQYASHAYIFASRWYPQTGGSLLSSHCPGTSREAGARNPGIRRISTDSVDEKRKSGYFYFPYWSFLYKSTRRVCQLFWDLCSWTHHDAWSWCVPSEPSVNQWTNPGRGSSVLRHSIQ